MINIYDDESWLDDYARYHSNDNDDMVALGELHRNLVQSALDKVNKHPNITVIYECEEGMEESDIDSLLSAIRTAHTSELEKFMQKNRIPFEDGYLIVSGW